MSNLLRERMSPLGEARSLLRAIYNAEGDILPEPEAGTLTIRLHQLANHMSSESIRYLCKERKFMYYKPLSYADFTHLPLWNGGFPSA